MMKWTPRMPVTIVASSKRPLPGSAVGDIKNATPSPIVTSSIDEVDHMPPGQHQRLAADRAPQLEKRDDRARKRDRADADADKDLAEMQAVLAPRVIRAVRHQDTSQTRPAPPPDRQSCAASRRARGIDVICTREARIAPITSPGIRAAEQDGQSAGVHRGRGRDERDQHSEDAVQIAAPGGLLLRQSAEAQNKQRTRGDVCDCDQGLLSFTS